MTIKAFIDKQRQKIKIRRKFRHEGHIMIKKKKRCCANCKHLYNLKTRINKATPKGVKTIRLFRCLVYQKNIEVEEYSLLLNSYCTFYQEKKEPQQLSFFK